MPPTQLGSYELIEPIAEGGMASVWLARSRGAAGFEKTVVIKRVLPSLMARPTFRDLLVREAKIAALLTHPNIVQIFDLGEADGAYFIAMEHVHGVDLGRAMMFRPSRGEEDGRLSVALKLWIIAEVARALDYAHRRRDDDGRPLSIVHRDVSPHNVLLSYEGAVKVADFGIARADQEGLGKDEDPKMLRGKYAYMSPEQSRGEPLDRRSDVFSLGIIFYELLTLTRLFRTNDSRKTLKKVREASVPRLDLKAMGLPEEVQAIVDKMLSRDPDDRYANAGDVRKELLKILYASEAGPVDETNLGLALRQMFPLESDQPPNKLRVDIMLRAMDDATSVRRELSVVRTMASLRTDVTSAISDAKSERNEVRPLVLLVTKIRTAEFGVFATTVEGFGGAVVHTGDGATDPGSDSRSGSRTRSVIACFGQGARPEQGPEHAARAAMEFARRQRRDGVEGLAPVSPSSLLPTLATIRAGEVSLSDQTQQEALKTLVGRSDAFCQVSEELRGALARGFVLSQESPVRIERFRARADQALIALRDSVPLVGRRAEVTLLTSAVAGVLDGLPARALMLVGEPGMGKTRLMAEVRALVGALDLSVVFVRCEPGAVDGRFAPLRDLFAALSGIEPEDPPEVRFRKVERLRILGLKPREVRRAGGLLGLSYPVAEDPRLGRPRGIELVLAARRALRSLSQERPVLLIVEDVAHMDGATRQLLPLLIEGLTRSGITILLTSRLGLIPLDPDLEHVALVPLDAASTARAFALHVGGAELDADLAGYVFEQTGGIPGWIAVLARALKDTGRLKQTGGLVQGVPVEWELSDEARALATSRLAELRPIDRQVMRLAAVFKHDILASELFEAAGLSVEMGESCVRRLLGQGLLVPESRMVSVESLRALWPGSGEWGGGYKHFRSPETLRLPCRLLQRAVLLSVPDRERRRLFGTVLSVLERTVRKKKGAAGRGRTAELAYYATRSVDRRRAVDYCLRAVEGENNTATAAELMASAAELVAGNPDSFSHDQKDLTFRAADLCITAQMLGRAQSLLNSLAIEPDAEPALLVREALLRSRLAVGRGHMAEGARTLLAVEERLPEVEDAELRGRVLLAFGQLELRAGRPASAYPLLTEAAEAFVSAGTLELEGRAYCGLSIARARLGEFSEAERAVSQALALSARLGQGPLRHEALDAMAGVQDAQGSTLAAAQRWGEVAEIARLEDWKERAAWALVRSAFAFLLAGDRSEAAVMAEQGFLLARGHFQTFEALARGVRSLIAAGDVQAAAEPPPMLDTLPDLVRLAETCERDSRWEEGVIAARLLGMANERLGDQGAAARSFERAADLADVLGHAPLSAELREKANAVLLS